MNLRASPQLEYWNTGIMGFGGDVVFTDKITLNRGVSKCESPSHNQHSNILLFHARLPLRGTTGQVRGKKHQASKNPPNFSKLHKFRDVRSGNPISSMCNGLLYVMF